MGATHGRHRAEPRPPGRIHDQRASDGYKVELFAFQALQQFVDSCDRGSFRTSKRAREFFIEGYRAYGDGGLPVSFFVHPPDSRNCPQTRFPEAALRAMKQVHACSGQRRKKPLQFGGTLRQFGVVVLQLPLRKTEADGKLRAHLATDFTDHFHCKRVRAARSPPYHRCAGWFHPKRTGREIAVRAVNLHAVEPEALANRAASPKARITSSISRCVIARQFSYRV